MISTAGICCIFFALILMSTITLLTWSTTAASCKAGIDGMEEVHFEDSVLTITNTLHPVKREEPTPFLIGERGVDHGNHQVFL
jgi:hypothetical protein